MSTADSTLVHVLHPSVCLAAGDRIDLLYPGTDRVEHAAAIVKEEPSGCGPNAIVTASVGIGRTHLWPMRAVRLSR